MTGLGQTLAVESPVPPADTAAPVLPGTVLWSRDFADGQTLR